MKRVSALAWIIIDLYKGEKKKEKKGTDLYSIKLGWEPTPSGHQLTPAAIYSLGPCFLSC